MNDSLKVRSLGGLSQSLFLFLIILIPLIFFFHTTRNLSYELQGFILSLLLIPLSIFFFFKQKKKEDMWLFSKTDTSLLLFLGFVFVSFSLVSDYLASFQTVLRWCEVIIFFIFARNIFRDSKARRFFLLLLPGLGAIGATFFSYSIIEPKLVIKNYSYFPFALNRNFAAQFFILPLFVSLAFLGKENSKNVRTYAGISSLLIFTGIILSRSRAVWLGLVLVALLSLIYLFLNNRKQANKDRLKKLSRNILYSVGLIILLLVCAHFILPHFDLPSPFRTLETLRSPLEGSAGGRIRRWINAIPMIKDHFFFGVGPGNWANTFFKYRDGILIDAVGYPHSYNAFLDVLGEFGIFAFLAFCFFFLSFFRRKYYDSTFVFFLKAGLVTFLFSLAFHMTFSIKILLFTLFLILALLGSFEDEKYQLKTSRKATLTASGLICIFLLVISTFEWRYLNSKIHYNLIYYNQYYKNGSSNIRLATKLERKFYKFIRRNFPATDYREHVKEIDELARYGSGLRRNIYYGIALKEVRSGKKTDALAWYKKAETKSLFHNEILEARCKLELQLGHLADAKETCERACEIHHNNADLHLLLADVYQELDNKTDALIYYEKAITLYKKLLEAKWVGKSSQLKKNAIKRESKKS